MPLSGNSDRVPEIRGQFHYTGAELSDASIPILGIKIVQNDVGRNEGSDKNAQRRNLARTAR